MTSSPTVSSRKWADFAKSENTGPIGIAKAPGAVTIVGGSHLGSGARRLNRCVASKLLRIGLTPSGQSSCRTNSPSRG